MNGRTERTLFFAFALLVFVYLILRAVLVPLTHDEAATFQTYVLTGRFLPFLSHWDAGNHLLITAIGRATYLLFGAQPMAVRSFALLCFALQAWYTWRITRSLNAEVVRWCAMAALLFTPFLIEFFALFRGYGPSLAFMLMALYHTMRYATDGGRTHVIAALVALSLATFASLSVLVICGLLLVIIAVTTLLKHRRDGLAWLAWMGLGALPLAFATCYGMELSERGLLYYGSEEGLVKGTLGSLAIWVVGIDLPFAQVLLGIAFAALLGWLIVEAIRKRNVILMVLAILIVGELLARWVMGTFLGVLYPMDRTAMHLIPLIVLAFAFLLDGLAQAQHRWAYVSLLLLGLPLHAAVEANVDHTAYWPEQAIPTEVFQLVAERQATMDRPLLIAGYRQNPRAWIYGAAIRDLPLNFLDDAGFPQPTCDLMIIDPDFFKRPPGFHALFAAPHGRMELLERDAPLQTRVALDTTRVFGSSDAEFVELWSPDPSTLNGKEHLVELDAQITAEHEPLELRLVVEAKDAQGNGLHYDVIDIEDQRTQWHGDGLHILRRLPAFKDPPSRVVVYLWGPQRQTYAIDKLRLIVHEVQP